MKRGSIVCHEIIVRFKLEWCTLWNVSQLWVGSTYDSRLCWLRGLRQVKHWQFSSELLHWRWLQVMFTASYASCWL